MALTRLWTGMRTWAIEDAETDETIVLIINDNGHDDLLHHNFKDTPQTDQEKGRSNLYEVPDVGPMNIDPNNFNRSSIRVGIRGSEAWAPEDFFVFGEEADGSPRPLALARKITKWLSTDPADQANDARLSIPIPPVILGNSTTQIFGLLVLMLTDADGTDGRIQLRISTPDSLKVVFEMPPPVLPPDSAQGNQFHQEANEASFYYVEEETGQQVIPFTKSATGLQINLSLLEANDSWLPKSFFIFGLDTREEAAGLVRIVPLVHIPEWNLGPLGVDQTTVPLPLI